jgi:CheY-like chemotaxis protein
MGRRVLVVDDDPLVLELVSCMLEELGCETWCTCPRCRVAIFPER